MRDFGTITTGEAIVKTSRYGKLCLMSRFQYSLIKNYLPLAFFAVLSILIMAPLFEPGHILMLDASSISLGFGDHLFGQGTGERLPYHIIAGAFDLIFPHWVVQKVIWFLAFLLAGLGAYKLCPAQGKAGKYFAGILYMVNPFIYAHLLAGQSLLTLSYALIPFAIYYFIALLEKGDKKSLILTTILTTVITTLQLHMLFLTFISFLVILLAKMIQKRRDSRYLLAVTKRAGLLSSVFLLLNIYWLVPLLTAESSPLSQLGREDMLYFVPRDTTGLRVGLSILSLHGFWQHGPYLYTKDIFPGWWLVAAFILSLSMYGIVTKWGDEKRGIYVKSMTIIGVVAIILALGVSSNVTKPLFTFLWERLFFFSAFRDSQKFVALLVLAYSFLGGLGVAAFAESLGKKKPTKIARVSLTILVTLALIAPILNCFTIFNGFWGQIKPTDFPEDWYEINEFLNEDSGDFNVVFLPWHSYMDYSWLPQAFKRTRNIADWFFDKPVIGGDNIEIGETYTQSPNPMSRYMEFLFGLPNRKERNITNLGELTSLVNAKYVLLTKEADWKWYYDLLHRQEDLTLVKETSHLLVFRNEHRTARIYQVSNVAHIKDWDELLVRSKSEDVMDYLYLIGDGGEIGSGQKVRPVTYQAKSPAKYVIEGSTEGYTIFVPTQHMDMSDWEYKGTGTLKHLGFMPAFETGEAGGALVHTRFYHVYLPSYIISFAAAVLLACYYFWPTTIRRRIRLLEAIF